MYLYLSLNERAVKAEISVPSLFQEGYMRQLLILNILKIVVPLVQRWYKKAISLLITAFSCRISTRRGEGVVYLFLA